MNRRKLNMFLWSLGLTVLLMAAALMGITGTSLARYRAEATEPISITPRPVRQIRLGQMVSDSNGEAFFVPDAQGSWEEAEGGFRLSFAVSNLIDAETIPAEDQQFFLRLVGTPGLWDGAETVTIKLLIPSEETENLEEPAEPVQLYEEFQASATRINPASPLYTVFGDGWVFTFPDETGNERSWTLDGGAVSVLEMTLTLEGAALTDPSLLQLQIIGE